MPRCRLLVVAPDATCAAALADVLTKDEAETVWHHADDGGIFVSVLRDGLWDAVVFWGDPKGYAGGRGIDLVKASAPELPVIIVSNDNAGQGAAAALQVGAKAWIPRDDLGRIGGVLQGIQADRARNSQLGQMAAVAGQHTERYRGLIELSPDPLLVHRRGVFIYANAAMARLLGVPGPEQLEGKTLFDFLHPDDRTDAVTRAQRVWSVAQLPPAEWRVFAIDGSLHYVETSAWPIIYEDEPANLLVCRDVTERRLAEEARQRLLVQEQEARAAADEAREWLRFLADAGATVNAQLDHKATLENVAGILVPRLSDWCIIDEVLADGTVDQATVVHGDEATVAGIRQSRAQHPVDMNADHRIARVFRSGKSELIADLAADEAEWGPEADLLRAARDQGVRSILCVPLVARDRVLGVLTVGAQAPRRHYTAADVALIEEIAGRAALAIDNARLYETLRETDRRKEEFLGLLGHELRNPLAGIRNAAALVRRRADQPDQVMRWVDVIDRQQQLLSRLVADLLDVSRINSGKIVLSRRPIDLGGVVMDSVHTIMLSHGLSADRIQVRLPDHPVVVDGDAMRLAQIIANLLDNAQKYNKPDGEIVVTLSDRDGKAHLTVADTGVGMVPAALSTIFEPFVQLSVGDRTKAGLGLGLTLVKRLTEMHGGTVTAESAGEGLGSTFSLTFPVLPPP